MSRKPVAPVEGQEGVRHDAPGQPASGPSTSRPAGLRTFLSIDVTCSVCGAQPGQRCQTRNRDGKLVVADISHNPRAKCAEDVTKRWAAWHGDAARNWGLPPL